MSSTSAETWGGGSLLTDRIGLQRAAWAAAFRDYPATQRVVLTKAEGAVHVSARWQRLNGYFSQALGETRPAILRHGLVRVTAD